MRGVKIFAVLFILNTGVYASEAPDTAWTRGYNPCGLSDRATGIAVNDSGIFVTGSSCSLSVMTDYLTVKYDFEGNMIWANRYNYNLLKKMPINYYHNVYGIAADDSGIYVTGDCMDIIPYGNDYCQTIMYDYSGDTMWVRRHNSVYSNLDHSYDIATNGQGIYITGYAANDDSAMNNDVQTIKYTRAGDTAWVKYHYTAGFEEGYAITATESNIFVAGRQNNGWYDYFDYILIKYDLNGDTVWTRRYFTPADSNDRASAIAVNDSGIYVTGYRSNGDHLGWLTIKYRQDGDTVWSRRYNSEHNQNETASAIALDSSGVYIAGTRYNGDNTDLFIIKYGHGGDSLWAIDYNSPYDSSDGIGGIAVDDSAIYVTGCSFNGTDYDFVTIKYNKYPEVGKEEQKLVNKTSLNVLQNPIMKSGLLSYAVPSETRVSLKIYDITGKVVKTLVNGTKEPGNYEVGFDAGGLADGVYFVELRVGYCKINKKLVLLK